MDRTLMNKILFAQLRSGRDMTITVSGVSMNPILYEGDAITVHNSTTYEIGDILVFMYKGELLAHRLLKIEKNRFFCKGDNAFRLEDLPPEAICGKVICCNGQPIPSAPGWLVDLSYKVNREFRKCRYDVVETKKSGIYRFYYKIVWKVEDNTLKYRKNEMMDYIPTDETSLAIFDPESGDTHFLDEVGIDILNCLDESCDLSAVLDKLCEMYDATPEDIIGDVEEFLVEMVQKKVVLVE